MAIRDELKARIDQKKDAYIEVAKRIHGYAEIGNEEIQSAAELVTLLKDAGFDVETSIAGHETGFIGKKSSSKPGRNVVFLAEYDALPGLGHACGHNIIGTTSVAAAIALADDLEQIGGTVYVYGTPAEEGGPNGSAKGSFVKAGLFDEIDAALMIHPSRETGTTGATLAVDPLEFHFTGRAAHAAGSPEEGINALDGVLQLFSGINALRQQLASTIRIHGIITHGGDAPNIIPDYAAARFFIRATTWEEVAKTSEKVQQIARGAALQTGAEVDIKRFQNEIHEFVRNSALDEALREELEALGEEVHAGSDVGRGSTDAGNVSRVVPTAHPYIKIGPETLVGHTHEFREASNSELGYEALIKGAVALSSVGYRLLSDDNYFNDVREAFEGTRQKATV